MSEFEPTGRVYSLNLVTSALKMPGDEHNKVVVLVPFPYDPGSPGLIEGVKGLLAQFGTV